MKIFLDIDLYFWECRLISLSHYFTLVYLKKQNKNCCVLLGALLADNNNNNAKNFSLLKVQNPKIVNQY